MKIKAKENHMIPIEFVKKYLDVKEQLEKGKITEEKYRVLIIKLCCLYQVDPAKLAEHNMELEPKKLV